MKGATKGLLLTVAAAIILVIAGQLYLGYRDWRIRQRIDCVEQMRATVSSIEIHRRDHGRLPKDLKELGSSAPLCPRSGLSYSYEGSPDGFTIYCRGNAHADTGVGLDCPGYTTSQGWKL